MNALSKDFDKLNRLRQVAGKAPLKSWKASGEQLASTIKHLEADGYEDPGPPAIDVKAPVDIPKDFIPQGVDFGPDAKADTPPSDIPRLQDTAAADLAKIVVPPDDKPAREPTKVKARLARGVDGAFTEHCRAAVYSEREKTKKEKKADKLRAKESKRVEAGKDLKKPKKSKIKKNKDGTATKTTTAGNKRPLGKDLADKIDKLKANKHSDKRSDPDNFTVPELARECDMDPKVARAKLRRHEDKIKKLHTKGQDRWVFPNSAKKALKAILCPEK